MLFEFVVLPDLMLAGLTDESLLAVFTGAAELHGAKADEYLMRREHRDAVIPCVLYFCDVGNMLSVQMNHARDQCRS
jgi:hypothetical protein